MTQITLPGRSEAIVGHFSTKPTVYAVYLIHLKMYQIWALSYHKDAYKSGWYGIDRTLACGQKL